MKRRPLKIGIIGSRGVPATFGGVERHVEEVGARLAERGHTVVVFCRSNYVEKGLKEYRGMKLCRLPTVGTKRLDALVHSGIATFAAIFQRGYDILHYHAIGPSIWTPFSKVLSRARIVQTIHGLDHLRAKWNRFEKAALKFSAWISAKVVDEIITVAHYLADHYEKTYHRKAVCIPNGINARPRLQPKEIKERFGLKGKDYILFVGRLVPEKAPDLLVRAFRHLDGDLRLVIAGGSSFTDDYVNNLHELASKDPRVIMAGYVYGDLLDELYTNAAFFVLPSNLEGLPITLLEAASYGVPVVASDIEPHKEVLKTSSLGKRLVKTGNEEALLTTMKTVISNLEEEQRGAELLREEILEQYSWDKTVDALENCYYELIAKKKR